MRELLTTGEAARFLKMHPDTLPRYRVQGSGPRYYKLAKFVRYERTELVEWVRRRQMTSTSEMPK